MNSYYKLASINHIEAAERLCYWDCYEQWSYMYEMGEFLVKIEQLYTKIVGASRFSSFLYILSS